MSTPEPKFNIIIEDSEFQIREYPKIIFASVFVNGGYNYALNRGFSILADYIFGNNKKRSSIEMTVPVVQQESERMEMTVPVTQVKKNDGYKISFVMPEEYSLETLPEPMTDRITFEELRNVRYGIVRFTGFISDGKIKKKRELLKNFLKKNNIENTETYFVARYDNPFSIPFLRRNELFILLK